MHGCGAVLHVVGLPQRCEAIGTGPASSTGRDRRVGPGKGRVDARDLVMLARTVGVGHVESFVDDIMMRRDAIAS